MSDTNNRQGCTTLEEYLEHHDGKLPEQEVIELARQVLDALRIIHTKGFVHNAIWPSNIRMTQHGIRLEHFNVSDMVRKPTSRSPFPTHELNPSIPFNRISSGPLKVEKKDKTTSKRERQLYKDYLSPEYDSGSVDNRSDLYSVGILCYQCLTGKTVVGVRQPSELAPEINPDWDWWISMAIAQNPDERFDSTQAMTAELPTPMSEVLPTLPEEDLTSHIESQINGEPQRLSLERKPIPFYKNFWFILSTILISSASFIGLCIKFVPKIWE
jgi:serine/threonine protein kinase